MYIIIYIYLDLHLNIYSYFCVHRGSLENHARINEHMQNLMNTMAPSIKAMEKSLKTCTNQPTASKNQQNKSKIP